MIEKVAEDLDTPRRVRNFGMELQTVQPAALVAHGGHRVAIGVGQRCKALRHAHHRVAVTHPADEARLEPGEEIAAFIDK